MGEISAKARGQEEEEGERGRAECDSKRLGETDVSQREERRME